MTTLDMQQLATVTGGGLRVIKRTGWLEVWNGAEQLFKQVGMDLEGTVYSRWRAGKNAGFTGTLRWQGPSWAKK